MEIFPSVSNLRGFLFYEKKKKKETENVLIILRVTNENAKATVEI